MANMKIGKIALNTSTYTELDVPARIGDLAVWTEDGTAFTVSLDSTGTNSAVVPADTPLAIGRVDKNLFFLADSGTPNLAYFFSKK